MHGGKPHPPCLVPTHLSCGSILVDTNSPWSAFFSGQTKVTVIKTGKRVGSGQAALSPAVGVTKGSRRRSKSVDLGHTPVKRVSRSPERRFRRNSGGRDDDPRLVASPPRDSMNSANRLLPNVQMMPRYDPPTILLGPSEEDENHEETINDVLDKISPISSPVAERKPRRDTQHMITDIKV